MKKTGLLFGSFNPVHIGHLIIAEFFAGQEDLDEVWLVVSPQNPFKPDSSLADVRHRMAMVELAVANNPLLKACDVELSLPTPSYTADTLRYLAAHYPDRSFALLIGEDNVRAFGDWKNAHTIPSMARILVYPRPGTGSSTPEIPPTMQLVAAPRLEVSATAIRALIRSHRSVRYLVPDPVIAYMNDHMLYR